MDEQTIRELWAPTLGDQTDWTVLDGEATYRSLPGADETLSPLDLDQAGQSPFVPGAEIGRGGVGVVYRARQSSLGRDVALKTPHSEQEAHAFAGPRGFFVEALINGRLEHPNIVPVHDLGRGPDGGIFLAMKLVEGDSWRALLDRPEKDLVYHLEILLQVCNAVAFAHSRGVVHNDLKPENVMVGRFGEVLLMDWGLAVEFGQPARLRHRSQVTRPCGTPGYMPPELAEGRGQDIGPHTDVYLLGGILFRLLSGRTPHHGHNFVQTVLHAVLGRVGELPGEVPRELRQICLKALAGEPAARHSSVEAFQSALRAFLRHRESLLISSEARQTLDAALARDTLPRSQLYEKLATAVAGFAQAQRLWSENPEAARGSVEARRAYAELALGGGDLALAATQLDALADSGAPAPELRLELQGARRRRTRERLLRRNLQWGLASAFMLIMILLGAWWWADTDRVAELRNNAQWAFDTQRSLVRELNGDSLRVVMHELGSTPLLQAGQDRPFHLSNSEQHLHAQQIRGFFYYVSQSMHLAELATQVVEEHLLQQMPAAALDSLRIANQVDHELAVRLAIANQSFELAETFLASHPDAKTRAALRAELAEQRTAALSWQITQTERALEDLRLGRGRADRPRWWPTPEEYVIQLSRFRDKGVVQVLHEHLQAYTRRAQADASIGLPVPWTQAESEEIAVILQVLGMLDLPDVCLPPLIAFASAVWDPKLAVVSGLALCNTGDRRAEEFLYRELRERMGVNSSVWTQVSGQLARIRSESLDAAEIFDLQECLLQGLRLSAKGEGDAALRMYARAIELDSTLVSAFNDRGVVLLGLGRYTEAYEDFTRAIGLGANTCPFFNNRGQALLYLGRLDDARRDFDHAIELDPSAPRPWASRGTLWLELDSLDLAVRDYQRAMELDPYLEEAVNNLAATYSRLERLDDAIRMFDRALSLDPRDTMAYTNRALTYLQLGEPARSLADCDRALRLDPRLTGALSTRGSAYLALNQPSQALADFEHALALGDSSAVVLSGRGAGRLVLQDYEGAESDLRAALALGMGGGQIYLQLGVIEQHYGRNASAVKLFDRALEEDPQLVTALVARGSLLGTEREFGGALRDFDLAIAIDPQASTALTQRGQLLLVLERYQESLRDFERALALGAESGPLRVWQGMTLLDLERCDEALACFERAEQLGVSGYALQLRRAAAYEQLERLPEATAACSRAIAADTTRAESWLRRGALYHAQGQLSEAMADCERSLQLDPEEAEAWALRGGLHQEAGALLESMQDFETFIALKPDEARGFAMRAQSWFLLGDLQATRADLDKALELQPGLIRARLLRAELFSKQRAFPASLADIQQVLQTDPEEPDAYYMLGTVMRLQQVYAEAEAAYDRAIELRPGHFDALQGRGFVHMALRELESALDDFNTAIEVDPEAPATYLLRGRVYHKLGDYPQALRDYQSCHARDPQQEEALVRSGDLLLEMGRLDEARAAFSKALELGFDSGRVQFNLGVISMREADHATALEYFLRAAELQEDLAVALYNAACMLCLLAADRSTEGLSPEQIDETDEMERTRAFELLELARLRGYDDRELLRGDTDLDFLHDDPRWPALLERMTGSE